jgi:hypothetical protein
LNYILQNYCQVFFTFFAILHFSINLVLCGWCGIVVVVRISIKYIPAAIILTPNNTIYRILSPFIFNFIVIIIMVVLIESVCNLFIFIYNSFQFFCLFWLYVVYPRECYKSIFLESQAQSQHQAKIMIHRTTNHQQRVVNDDAKSWKWKIK